MKSKQVYWFLNTQIIAKPSCFSKWFDKYFIEFSSFEWKKMFMLCRQVTNDTKLIEFQFKIIHRVYATDTISLIAMCQLVITLLINDATYVM